MEIDTVSIDGDSQGVDELSYLDEFIEMSLADWLDEVFPDLPPDTSFIEDTSIEGGGLGLNYTGTSNNVIGDPLVNMTHWEMQERSDSCAPTAQGFVIEHFAGVDIPEDALIEISEANGWYDSSSNGGTSMEDVGNLLEVFGIQTERMTGATMDTIRDCLRDGCGVIVAVDSGELWYGDNDFFFDWTPDHAVQVIGVDDENGMVILNDPGAPDGCGVMYPIELFVDAWADSNCFLVKAIPGTS